MTEFFPIFIFLIISLGLSLILVGIPFIVAPQKADPEKISAYECGFDPCDDARGKFDIRMWDQEHVGDMFKITNTRINIS